MQPLTFIYDPAETRLRLGLALLLVSVALLVAGMSWFESLGFTLAERQAGALPLLLPILASFWIFFRLPPPDVEDRLRIDAEGLSFGRGGRTRTWRWSEISDVRLFGYLHPAALACDPVIAFQVPTDGRRSGILSFVCRILFFGRNAAIWGYYNSSPDFILRAIAHYRDQALGNAPPLAAPSGSPPEPAIYHLRRKPGKLQSPAVAALIGLLGGLIGLSIFVAIAVLMGGAWPHDWASFQGHILENKLVRIVSTFIPVLVLVGTLATVRRNSRFGNLLLLSSGGLHIRGNDEHRRWLWSEILAPELRRLEKAGIADEQDEAISFIASHDGKRPGKEPEGGPLPATVSEAVEDIYDAPLGEIARRVQAWHATAVLDQAPTAAPEPAGQATAPLAAEALTFRRRWPPAHSIFVALTLAAMWVFMIGGVIAMSFLQDPEISGDAKLLLKIAFFLLGVAAPFFLIYLMASGGKNILRLDHNGLTYVRLGRVAGWTWRDLSPFELGAGSSRWSKRQVPLITATLRSGDDRLSRFMRWAYGIAAPRPLTVIEDVYDTPPGEILRLLNEHRERALGPAGAA